MRLEARTVRVALAAFLLVAASGVDPLQSIYRSNREGSRALASGDVESAIRAYEDALEIAPDDPRLSYNLGNALARAGRIEEADRAWQRAVALGEGELKRDAWFNRGVAALGAEAPEPAARSFAEALVVDPADAEARRNLELALRRLQPQQQPQQQQQQDSSRENQGEQDNQEQQQQQQENQDRRQQDSRENENGQDDQEQQQQDQPQQGEPQKDSEEQAGQEGERRDQASESEGPPVSDAEREMAERVLEKLGQEELDALRRALRRRAGPAPDVPKEKDW